jgi:hypothetical protein
MYPVGAVQPLSDGAAYFDGTDDRISLGSQTNVAGGALTMSAWVYLIQDQLAPVLSFGDALLRFQDADDLRGWGDVSGGSVSTAITSALNRWTHVAFTHDAGAGKIYVDGVQKASGTHTVLSADSRPSYIGNYSGGYFEGYISNVGAWNRALTPAEIKSIMWKQYADLSTSEKTSLVSWWNLDSVPQASNSYRTGTNKGYVAYSEGASDHGSNIAFKDFVPTNDIELGSDIFGGEGSFTSDTGYWTLANDTIISNGLVITDSGSGNYNGISKTSILTAGKIYKLSFDIIEANMTDTLIRFNWGDYTDAEDDAYPVLWSNTSGSTDTTGSYYMYFEPGANTATTFIIYCSQSGTSDYTEVKLDNLVCQEVLNAGVLI